MINRLPPKQLAGVDLRWHADLAARYATQVLHEESNGRPLYANYIWGAPAHMDHSEWDVPYCVGLLLLFTNHLTANLLIGVNPDDTVETQLFVPTHNVGRNAKITAAG